MNLSRILRHLAHMPARTRCLFPPEALNELTTRIGRSEHGHSGEIRLIIEGSLDLDQLLSGMTARDRAVELFSRERVWDTEHNTGILVYLLLAERQLEIVADRGISARVPQARWDAICQAIAADLAAGRHVPALEQGLAQLDALLAEHVPPGTDNPDELANAPLVL